MAAAVLAGGPAVARRRPLRVNGVDVIGADPAPATTLMATAFRIRLAAPLKQRETGSSWCARPRTGGVGGGGSERAAVAARLPLSPTADPLAPDAADGAQTALARSILHDLPSLRAPRSAALHELLPLTAPSPPSTTSARPSRRGRRSRPSPPTTTLSPRCAPSHSPSSPPPRRRALRRRRRRRRGRPSRRRCRARLARRYGHRRRACTRVWWTRPPLQCTAARRCVAEADGSEGPRRAFLLLARLCRRRVDGAAAAGSSDGGGGTAAADGGLRRRRRASAAVGAFTLTARERSCSFPLATAACGAAPRRTDARRGGGAAAGAPRARLTPRVSPTALRLARRGSRGGSAVRWGSILWSGRADALSTG